MAIIYIVRVLLELWVQITRTYRSNWTTAVFVLGMLTHSCSRMQEEHALRPEEHTCAGSSVGMASSSPTSRSHAEQFQQDGYVLLPGLLTPSEIARFVVVVKEQVASGTLGPRVGQDAGYYTSDASLHPQLREIVDVFNAKPELHAALRQIFGGDDQYHALPRNDLMVDQAAAPKWHRDQLNGALGSMIVVPEWTEFEGERYEIVNAGFYLEDHSHDDYGLWVAPGSHSREENLSPAHNTSVHTIVLHPKVGDAIIWDWRTYHRGGYAKTEGNSGSIQGPAVTAHNNHRTLFAASFGKKNIFSELMARGLELKHTTASLSSQRMSLSGCNGTKAKDWRSCQEKYVQSDLEDRPLTQKLHQLIKLGQEERSRQSRH